MFNFLGLKAKTINPELTIEKLYHGLEVLELSYNHVMNDRINDAKEQLESIENLKSEDLPSNKNPLSLFGKAILAFQTSIMGFEEAGFSLASKELFSSEDTATAWSNAIQNSIKANENNKKLCEKLKRADLLLKLITADSLLMLSCVSFLSQSISEYAKAAYRLKKAYDSFSHLNKVVSISLNTKEDFRPVPFSVNPEDPFDSFLISGISFGLGLIKLMISSLPRKAKVILNGVGFNLSERNEAISYLRNSILYKGLHGSLSSMLLLSFYSAWLTFVSHLPISETREYHEAESLIPKFRELYPQGRIWILLECKIIKLNGKLDEAAQSLENVLEVTTDSWPELKYLIMYEYAWCKILQGDYAKAAKSFNSLRSATNWSKAFYSYLEATCHLRTGDVKKAIELFILAPTFIRKRLGGRMIPIEAFVKNRASFYNDRLNSTNDPNLLLYALPQLEVTYYFNCFHFVPISNLSKQIEELNQFGAPSPNEVVLDDELNILSHLILGTIHRELLDLTIAEQHLKHLVQLPGNNTFQTTSLSYGHFELAVLEFTASPPSTPTNKTQQNQAKVTQHLEALNQHLFNSELEERLSYRLEWLKEDLPLSSPVLS